MSVRALAVLVTLALLPGCGLGAPMAAKRTAGALDAASAKKKPTPPKLQRPQSAPPELDAAGFTFRWMDRNADGTIEPLEWPIPAAANALGAPGFADVDADLDKKVTAFEWNTFALPRFHGAAYAQVDVIESFKAQDKDHGGKLTPDEFKQWLKALPEGALDALYLDTKSVSEWVLAADKNHDYGLDQAELETLLASLIMRRLGDV